MRTLGVLLEDIRLTCVRTHAKLHETPLPAGRVVNVNGAKGEVCFGSRLDKAGHTSMLCTIYMSTTQGERRGWPVRNYVNGVFIPIADVYCHWYVITS